jgi:hypothetical protein
MRAVAQLSAGRQAAVYPSPCRPRSRLSKVRFGQFKPPFGLERFTPSFEIVRIDRSGVTDTLRPVGSYMDSFFSDRVLQVDGAVRHRRSSYAAGVFDGRGANHRFHGVRSLVSGQVRTDVVSEWVGSGCLLT